VLHVARGSDGRNRVVRISELERIDPRGRATLKDVFRFKGDGDGGQFSPTGYVPPFAEGASPSMFRA
jgi:hypothetical protein